MGVVARGTKRRCHITVERPVCQMTAAGVAEKRIRFYYLHVYVCVLRRISRAR